MGITSYIEQWVEHLGETEGADPDELRQQFLETARRVIAEHYGDGPTVVVENSTLGLQAWLEYRASEEPPGASDIPMAALADAEELVGKHEAGDAVGLRICFTHHPALSEKVRELAARLAPEFEVTLHVPELWPHIEEALSDVVWETRGGRPAPEAGTLGARLRGDFEPTPGSDDDVTVQLVDVDWQHRLSSPTNSLVSIELEFRVELEAGEPFSVRARNGLGWTEDQWAELARLPAASDDGHLRTALDTLAKEARNLEGRAEHNPWFGPIVGALIRAPEADSLFGWAAAKFETLDDVDGPHLLPRSFGKASAVVELEVEDEARRVEVPLGTLSAASLDLAAPSDAVGDWLDDRLSELTDYAASALPDPEFGDIPTTAWPVMNALELAVENAEVPQPRPPIASWDEVSVKRLARRLRELAPDEQDGVETAAATHFMSRRWATDVWPVRIAGYGIDGWRLELVAERTYPWLFTAMLLSGPDSDDWVPVLWNDIWSPGTRWCADGDRFAFQAFLDLFIEAILEAGLDAYADARAQVHLFFSERGRAAIVRELQDGGAEMDFDEFFADVEARGPLSMENAFTAEPHELPWGGLPLTEWLRFDEEQTDPRWTLDWRVNYPSMVTATPIARAAPAMYGFPQHVADQLAEDAPRLWRRFLTEVIDHRFER